MRECGHDRRGARAADAILLRHQRQLARLFAQAVVGHRLEFENRFEVIRVGDAVPASKAAYRLHDVSEVHQLLAALAEGVTAGSRA